jgi:hypothetical protein
MIEMNRIGKRKEAKRASCKAKEKAHRVLSKSQRGS